MNKRVNNPYSLDAAIDALATSLGRRPTVSDLLDLLLFVHKTGNVDVSYTTDDALVMARSCPMPSADTDFETYYDMIGRRIVAFGASNVLDAVGSALGAAMYAEAHGARVPDGAGYGFDAETPRCDRVLAHLRWEADLLPMYLLERGCLDILLPQHADLIDQVRQVQE